MPERNETPLEKALKDAADTARLLEIATITAWSFHRISAGTGAERARKVATARVAFEAVAEAMGQLAVLIDQPETKAA